MQLPYLKPLEIDNLSNPNKINIDNQKSNLDSLLKKRASTDYESLCSKSHQSINNKKIIDSIKKPHNFNQNFSEPQHPDLRRNIVYKDIKKLDQLNFNPKKNVPIDRVAG